MPSNSPHPTLHTVAKLAGVSHMTVSRVVRGNQTVKPGTRKKVLKAIALAGYRPDPALSALAAYRSRSGGRGRDSVLAYLDCDANAYSALVAEGARAEALRLGYTLAVHRLTPTVAAQRRLSRMLFHRGVRGLLFGPSQRAWQFQGWDWPSFAPVSLGALAHEPVMNAVAMDYFEGASRAGDLLRQRGCQRIALMIDPSLEGRTGHRWIGGYTAHRPTPLLIQDRPLATAKAASNWLKRHRADGVLTIHRRVWQAASPLGLPTVFLNEFECPAGVAHLFCDTARLGVEGVRLIHHQLLGRDFGLPAQAHTVLLQATLANEGFLDS